GEIQWRRSRRRPASQSLRRQAGRLDFDSRAIVARRATLRRRRRLPTTDAAAITEARQARLPPGEGALRLVGLLGALPADASLSVEMPMPALEAPARIAVAFTATRRLLDQARRGTLRQN